jgi:hypothetical protein
VQKISLPVHPLNSSGMEHRVTLVHIPSEHPARRRQLSVEYIYGNLMARSERV